MATALGAAAAPTSSTARGPTTPATDGRQHTIVTASGRLGWTDGTGPPEINHAHHPEELLENDPDPPVA
ncbi:hypothetical protein [Mycolicibacter senuensis]|uniref:hypothetical protein n=1 Tax=Mycolicibacter senuensis TaxID=386913 RepID=UPI000DCD09E7|nr:hypothetical protein [Mycolicibacter senuensis]RAU90682.1 hypothetical protein DQP56_22690 [Mycolicibacter senuensis]